MKIKLKSISAKVGLLYLFLAILNISFFSIIIYENQVDLITENTKYHVKELTGTLIGSLEKFSKEMESSKIFKTDDKNEVIREVAGVISKSIEDFILFTEDGDVIYKSNADMKISKQDIANGIKAVTNMDFTGRQYYSSIDEESYIISFYVPFKVYMLDESILYLKVSMDEISRRLDQLYKIITLIIVIIAVFHIFFGIVLFRIVVKPIQALHMKSIEISEGNLSARASIVREDEIGSLGRAFNSMADSIQDKINTLQKQNDLIEYEMDIANDVQKNIYPELGENEYFNYAVYHNPFGKVSGDYYDLFPLGDSKYGFLILDVSGHGVPAALVTMIAKDMFNRYAPKFENPSDLFRHINSELSDMLKSQETHTMYFSAFYLIISQNKIVSYCNAGHLQSLIVRHKMKKISFLDTSGAVVGVSKDMNDLYETKRTKLDNGDKIILFTDGIVEAKNSGKVQFGTDRLIEAIKKSYLKSGKEILNSIVDDLSRFTDVDKLKDDATVFIIEVK